MNCDGIPIYLTKGYVAYVDPEDAHLVGYLWYANEKPNGLVYACRTPSQSEGSPTQQIKLHRQIMGVNDSLILVDHKDGDGLNCRRGNLRIADKAVNASNVERHRPGMYTHFKGVTYNKRAKRWVSQIRVRGRVYHVGYYSSDVEANYGRLLKERELIGVQPSRAQAFKDAGLC